MARATMAWILMGLTCCAWSQSPTLVAHWELDESIGPVCADATCNGLDGAYQQGVTLAQAGADPATGNSVDFDFTAMGGVDIPDGPPLTTLTSDLTVAAWINPRSLGALNRTRILANDESTSHRERLAAWGSLHPS